MHTVFARREVAVDLGTSNTLVWGRGHGLLLAEPSVVAIDVEDDRLLAAGHEARRMLGRTPSRIEVVEPLREGVISDFEATAMLLRQALDRTVRRRLMGQVDVVVCAPLGVTAVERRALEEAVRGAGAREAYVMEEPLAAAIGSGLPVAEPTGSMVVDIGGGTSEIAVVSLGGIVEAESVRIGGRHLDGAIQAHLQRRHKLAVGLTTAEELKVELGDATGGGDRQAEVRGRSLLTGLPRTVVVDAEEVAEAIAEPLDRIVAAIRSSLERTPPELAVDVMDQGVMLTGGGSLLAGLTDRLRAELHIPVHLAEQPLEAVARGAGQALEEMAAIRRAGPREPAFTGR
ncbi:rod shape-determining protein [Miltoncostaea marina]|uniref:rod shape-determining protein n=1 Tax=Miltoncostaea marina TaxID=2843215 RepID=UPI001C3E6065|nr:rod shape-determining protein [Miltoncostaea marina]